MHPVSGSRRSASRRAASAAAPNPKYRDIECRGFTVGIEDADVAEPFRLGVSLLLALRQQPEFELLRGGETLDRLTGSTELKRLLESPGTLEGALEAQASAVAAWRSVTAPFLLYP